MTSCYPLYFLVTFRFISFLYPLAMYVLNTHRYHPHTYLYLSLPPSLCPFLSLSLSLSLCPSLPSFLPPSPPPQAKTISQPFAYSEYRKERIKQKIDEQRSSRVKVKVDTHNHTTLYVMITCGVCCHRNCQQSTQS